MSKRIGETFKGKNDEDFLVIWSSAHAEYMILDTGKNQVVAGAESEASLDFAIGVLERGK